MSDTTRHEGDRPGFQLTNHMGDKLDVEPHLRPGEAVLGVREEIEPGQEFERAADISLHTADMVELRDYLSALIRRDVELVRQALADPEVSEDVKAAARRVLAGRDSGLARKVLADSNAAETVKDAAREILATAYGRETP
jgi:hypothetical protein